MRDPLVAVIGGSGFIGQALVELLLSDGCHVRVVSRQGGAGRPNLEEVRGDVSDGASMERALTGCDYVYSLSTGGGNSWADFERDIVGGARNVAEVCLKSRVKRLIYASSIAALYLGRRRWVTDAETADPQAAKRSYYAQAKALAETHLLERYRRDGLPVVILRPGVVMGRGGPVTHSGLGFWATDTDCIGWGLGTNPIPFVLVEDVAEALRQARTAPGIEGQAMNLASGVELTAREFVEEYARRSLRTIRFHPRPLLTLWAIDVFKWALKLAARKQENPFPYFRDFASRSLKSRLKCEIARTRLNWQPISSRDEFLRRSIDANLPTLPDGDLRLQACGD